MRSKYGNRKVSSNGAVFDSRREARRYDELLLLIRAGVITDLRRQVKFILIPAQRDKSDAVYAKGPNKGKNKPGKLLEKECAYIADFVYRQGGELVVEDSKGFRTEVYKIKRKLMLYIYGIRIREV